MTAGFLAFDCEDGMKSDHRLGWIKIKTESVLKKRLPTTKKITVSKLSFKNPRSRKKCIRLCKIEYRKAKVEQKIDELKKLRNRFHKGEEDLLDSIKKKYDRLHATTDKIRKDIEAKLTQTHGGRIP